MNLYHGRLIVLYAEHPHMINGRLALLLFLPRQSVVKVPWYSGEQRSCTSDYWQMAFPHLQVSKNAQEGKAELYSILLALPSWLGAHADNGVPSQQIFHFNHWKQFVDVSLWDAISRAAGTRTGYTAVRPITDTEQILYRLQCY